MKDVTSEWLEAHAMPWCYRSDSPALAETNVAFVLNLDDKTGIGTHWVAARAIKDKLLYADPFGSILAGYPPNELQHYKQYCINTIAWQRPLSTLCGYYAFLFARAMNSIPYAIEQKDFLHRLWLSIA